MRFSSPSRPSGQRGSTRYISRRSVPPTAASTASSALPHHNHHLPHAISRQRSLSSSDADPCTRIGLATTRCTPKRKWMLVKCALISSGLGLMFSAVFGVGLLDSSSSTVRTKFGGRPPIAKEEGGAHGVHAVASSNINRDFLRAKRGGKTAGGGDHRQKQHVDNARQTIHTETAANNGNNNNNEVRSPLARGVAGLPLSQTPALVGGRRGHINCNVDVDSLAYWNDPQGERDLEFVSPFAVAAGGKGGEEAAQTNKRKKYLTFQPDSGGWNNIRMSLEIIFIVALALGRTLVLPAPMPLYLLTKDKTGKRHRTFGDFYPLHSKAFEGRMEIITMEEFLDREGGVDGRFPIPQENRTAVLKAAKGCDHRKKANSYCGTLDYYLQSVGTMPNYHTHPEYPEKGKEACFIWDRDAFYNGGHPDKEVEKRAVEFCGPERSPYYFDSKMQESTVIHFKASERHFRLCQHFYGAVMFTDPSVDNYYKRFVRDFMHYHDAIYCAAGKIVNSLQKEGAERGMTPDGDTGAGGYSAMHIRRGDLQFKRVKIPAKRWYSNTKEIWKPKEILYIATDERNKTWFDPIREHHDLRFLDDYWDMAGLGDMDPNYMGMIDTIVASRGRAFAGTFFSTFSGYINRMRGYYGISMKDSYYSFEERKYEMHEWHQGPFHIFSHEWPTAWIGIDGDTVPSQDKF